MKVEKLYLLFFAGAFVFQFHSNAAAQLKIQNGVFGNGGTVISGANHQITSTVGQYGIGVTENSNNILKTGYWYQTGKLVTSIEEKPENLPTDYQLEQNFPNPFNPSTTIQFSLPKKSLVTIKLFNVIGNELAVILNEELLPGVHKVVVDGGQLLSGVYFYQMQTEKFTEVRKLIILK